MDVFLPNACEASVDPLRKGAAKELQNAIEKLGLNGLKLDPVLQDFAPNEPEAFEVYEASEALGIPTLVHTGMSWVPETPLERCHPLLWEQPVRRFPKLNFILAHFGWPWVWEAIAMAMKYPNVYLDTSCLYYDSPKEFFQFVFSKQVPTTLIERSLRNRIVFGSNYPRVEIKNMVHAVKSLALTEGCLHKIFVENAERLLARPEPGKKQTPEDASAGSPSCYSNYSNMTAAQVPPGLKFGLIDEERCLTDVNLEAVRRGIEHDFRSCPSKFEELQLHHQPLDSASKMSSSYFPTSNSKWSLNSVLSLGTLSAEASTVPRPCPYAYSTTL